MENRETILRKIATDLAYEKFEKMYGFGLYHGHPQAQKELINEARAEVEVWVQRLAPLFEHDLTS